MYLWSSELQLPLRTNVLCALNPCEDLAVKTAVIVKSLSLQESLHKNASEIMRVGYF